MCLVAWMRKEGIPVTRRNYIDLATNFGDPNVVEWSAEHEAELPDKLQNWDEFHRKSEAETVSRPPVTPPASHHS
jgi:hypothetical protein